MSVARFGRRLKLVDVRDSERTWFPRWLDGYVRFHRLDADRQLEVSESLVVGFLRSLRDNSYPAWKRCQAARAIECYQKHVIGHQRVDFGPIRRKLDELAAFLTELAVEGDVVAGTQNQALSAFKFLYEKPYGRELGFVNSMQAKESQYLPLVLTKSEVVELLENFRNQHRTMFQLLYGSGLRHGECRRLRVKDLCLESRQIVVRNGKGQKDRVTVLAVTSPLDRIQAKASS